MDGLGGQIVTALTSAAFVTAIAAAYVKIMQTRHRAEMDQLKARRTDRGDEIDVLQQAINELRGDRDALKSELAEIRKAFDVRWAERDVAFGQLKDEHTACQIKLQRVQASHEFLSQRLGELEKRAGVGHG